MERRRSQRAPLSVPVLMQSLDPLYDFTVRAVIVEVSSHGCQIRAPRPFMHGARLCLRVASTQYLAAARVVRSIPSESDMGTWQVGVELDQPSRFWGALHSQRLKGHLQMWRGRLRSLLYPA